MGQSGITINTSGMKIVVKRGDVALESGAPYFPGETLTVQVSAFSFGFVIESSGTR
jgi:hypothetical protein